MSKRVTAKDVAKALGISTMTVSRALNNKPNVSEETRRKVRQTSRTIGYFPNHIAKSLVLRKTDTIGVVVPEITHSFFPEVVSGIEEICYKKGYHLILAHSAENANRETDVIYTLTSNQVDGLLISTAQSVEDFLVYQQIIQRGLPLVFYDRCVKGIGASCVSIDDEECASQITEHLIEHDYYPIAHISGPSRISIGISRQNGFKKALKKHHLEVKDKLIVEAGLQEADGYQAMQQIFKLPRGEWPRAVVAVNDPAAFGAMNAIYERNLKIPDDIAIVGFSDDIRAELMPTPLTTIRQNAYEVGKKAVEKLIAVINNDSDNNEEIIVTGELIIRKSCGC
ncbi:MAG: LacI family DNA-binding transcriptional regulator [Calditrichia bacterium]|nr:LacI family DNA-binding transcriptional regulator [Calditrichia bacterium]